MNCEKLHLNPEQIRILNNHPGVKLAKENRVIFTYQFRCRIYEEWEKNQSITTVRDFLIQENVPIEFFKGATVVRDLIKNFKRHGYPSRAKNQTAYKNAGTFKASPERTDNLLKTGLFRKSRNGISFQPDYIDKLFHSYPEQSIEEGLRAEGIDPEVVGYQLIYHLKKQFDCEAEFKTPAGFRYSEEFQKTASENPFVKKISEKTFRLSNSFYNTAYPIKELHVDRILELFEIPYQDLPVSVRSRIQYKLKHWERSYEVPSINREILCRIYQNIVQTLTGLAENGLKEFATKLPPNGSIQKKRFLEALREFPNDPEGCFTTTKILKLTGISRNSFYSILRNEHYGEKQEARELQEQEDMKAICTVLDAFGFKKGSRQVYMQMSDHTDKQLSIKRIRRLMKKYHLESGIRKANHSRRAAEKMVQEQCKPNRLKRKFRLYRPGEVVLTDVTYLPYGNKQRCYGSALLDPVSGELLGFLISSTNDLQLVLDTLDLLKENSYPEGAIFHSDQGMLYMNPAFQKKVKELGFLQSMSRRGNCWDNAPQESFFSHFKQECSYSHLETVEEISDLVAKYVDYWNNNRRQWNRKRMTPVQYREYLNSLSETEFNKYICLEIEKYEDMKKRSVKKATERAKCLGAA